METEARERTNGKEMLKRKKRNSRIEIFFKRIVVRKDFIDKHNIRWKMLSSITIGIQKDSSSGHFDLFTDGKKVSGSLCLCADYTEYEQPYYRKCIQL